MVCTDCTRSVTARHPDLQGSGPVPCDVAVVVEAPGYEEDKNLKPGYNLRWLASELNAIGLDIDNVYITYAVKCYSASEVTTENMKACRQHLLDELKIVKPKHILCLGNTALYGVFGMKKAITKVRGEILTAEFGYGPVNVLPTYAVGAIVRSPEDMNLFKADTNYFVRMVEGNFDDLSGFKWRIVTKKGDLLALRTALIDSDYVAYDIETTSLKDTDDGKLLMVGVATKSEVFILPCEAPQVKHLPTWYDPYYEMRRIFNYRLVCIGQNAKFDNRWLRSRGVDNVRTDFDTYIAAYTLNNTLPHGLKYMAKVEFGAKNYDAGVEFTEDFPIREMAKYCALDCYYTRKLYPILQRRIEDAR